jgi:hypothetical protein
LSGKTRPYENATKTKLKKKQKPTKGSATAISTINFDEKLMLGKLNAYTIDWTDSRVTTLETMKYPKAYFLASQFKPAGKKVGFAALIGKVGGSAQTAFYPLSSQRAKLVESFLELVFNESPCWLIL